MISKQEENCKKKKIYFSLEKANLIAKILSKRRKVALRVYKCPFCKGYHLTSKEKWEE